MLDSESHGPVEDCGFGGYPTFNHCSENIVY